MKEKSGFFPIILGVRRKSGAEDSSARKNSAKRAKPEEILKRDDFTCRYCGFHSRKYQRVMPRDWASADYSAGNMVTACMFCEQCFALENAGMMGSGLLIWLPEITQSALNHMARAIYVARAEGGPMAEIATKALDALMARRAEAKRRLGSDDPLLLATVLMENLNAEEYRQRGKKLEGIRLLPLDKRMITSSEGDTNQFPQIVAWWRSDGPFADLEPAVWGDLLQKAAATAGRA